MPGLTDRISIQWDLWIEQFRAFFPTAEVDIRAGRELLSAHSRTGKPDAPFGSNRSGNFPVRWVACQDTRDGRVIACLELSDIPRPGQGESDGSQNLYHLEDMSESLQASLVRGKHFTLLPEYHKSAVTTVLLCHCVIEVLKAGGKGLVLPCALEHYSACKRVGMRPVGTLQEAPGGQLVIPMICVPDLDYLSIIHSPILPYLRELNFDRYQDIVQWYYRLIRENKALQTGASYYSEDKNDVGSHPPLTEGLSDAGRETLLRDALIMKCRPGEVLMNENDGGRAFGYVRKGLVQVVIGGKTVITLGEGDVFGEIAFILQSRRTAEVVAVSPGTEVVIFNESSVQRLSTETDRSMIWQNLARMLAQRLVMTNSLLNNG